MARRKRPAAKLPTPPPAPAPPAIAVPQPRLLTSVEAAQLLNMGRRTFDRYAEQGKIGPKPIRSSRKMVRWDRDELMAWLDHVLPDGQRYDRTAWQALTAEKADKETRRHGDTEKHVPPAPVASHRRKRKKPPIRNERH